MTMKAWSATTLRKEQTRMRNNLLSESELAFAQIIWEREPIRSGELAVVCNEQFGWKKSTTYTVLKNLCNAGIFQNKKSIVTSLVSQKQYGTIESTQIVERHFDGSLSSFVTAFAGGEKLSKKQIESLKQIIEEYE